MVMLTVLNKVCDTVRVELTKDVMVVCTGGGGGGDGGGGGPATTDVDVVVFHSTDVTTLVAKRVL